MCVLFRSVSTGYEFKDRTENKRDKQGQKERTLDKNDIQ